MFYVERNLEKEREYIIEKLFAPQSCTMSQMIKSTSLKERINKSKVKRTNEVRGVLHTYFLCCILKFIREIIHLALLD